MHKKKDKGTALDIFNEKNLDVIHIEKTKAKLSESETQTPLSLSSISPRKVHLYQQIRGYKRKIANLELELHKAKKMKKEDIHTLDMLTGEVFSKTDIRIFKNASTFISTRSKR